MKRMKTGDYTDRATNRNHLKMPPLELPRQWRIRRPLSRIRGIEPLPIRAEDGRMGDWRSIGVSLEAIPYPCVKWS